MTFLATGVLVGLMSANIVWQVRLVARLQKKQNQVKMVIVCAIADIILTLIWAHALGLISFGGG